MAPQTALTLVGASCGYLSFRRSILAVYNKRAPQGARLRSRLSLAPSFGSRLDPNAWLFASGHSKETKKEPHTVRLLFYCNFCSALGRGGGIRTHDLLVPNEARYQAAPHPECIM